jgi:hypothetical protein
MKRSFIPLFAALVPLFAVGCPADDTNSGGTEASDSTGATSTDPSASSNASNTMTSPTSPTAGATSETTNPTEPTTQSATATQGDSGSTGDELFCSPMLPPSAGCMMNAGDDPALGARAQVEDAWWGGGVDSVQGNPDPQGGGFIMMPDGGPPIECDIFAQDCPPGEKCMPWANDGGGNWNATRCSPIVPQPDMIGETCTVEGSGVSGLDSCEAASMCWNVDDNGDGVCVEMCSCSPDNPVCDTADTSCAITNGGVLALCLSACNPLDPQACLVGEGCYPVNDLFLCAPDASGMGGAEAEECANINGCDPGFVCVGANAYPGCTGAVGCCTSTCQVGDDSPCAPGTMCSPWFAAGGTEDACWSELGVCAAG